MSHFTVTVCLSDPAALDAALAPFSEEREVEPYREYEKGGPAEYWAVNALREDADLNPDDATLTWAQVAEAHNKLFAGSDPMLIDEMGRAYIMSTYNPDSKWDWWVIGGRWPGRFPYREENAHLILEPEPHWGSSEPIPPLHCDGGPKAALDLDGMREQAEAAARKEYARYETVTAGTPEALPRSVFGDNISEGAREEYDSQPRIAALRESPDFGPFTHDEDFAGGVKLYVERQRAQAVPGYATLTLDGRWMAPGEMGWWGMRSDTEGSRIGYWETANAYIDALPGSAYLVSVDCHI